MPSFLEELKRRNVFRVGIAYIITAWLVLQVADVVLGNISAPDWVFKTLLLFLSLGAPVVLVFAWAYEMTPEGLKREKDVDRTTSVTHVTGRKLDRTIIVILVLAVGYFAVDKFYLSGEASKDAGTAAMATTNRQGAAPGVADTPGLETITSIAVLPFVNMSSDKEQDYFSDGISEELLNLLAKIPAFRVAGRTSSFAFKGKNDDLRTIGESLGVSTILEGSVRKGANRVRITAQLVKVDDGFHLWSETYDRELTDVLAVQDEIAGAVVKELKVTLLGEQQLPTHVVDSLTGNAEAYNAYLQGLYFLNQFGPNNYKIAAGHFEQAVKLAPDSALAWAMLSQADTRYASQASDVTGALARAREAASKALELDDKVPEAHLAQALLLMTFDWDWPAAEASLRRALELRPGDVQAQGMLARLEGQFGHSESALAMLQAALVQDPLDSQLQFSIISQLYILGRYKEAEEKALGIKAREPEKPFINVYLGWLALRQGRYQEAMEYFQQEPVPFARLYSLAVIHDKLGQREAAEQAQQALLEQYGDAAAYQQALVFAEWGEPDTAIKWLQRAYDGRDPGMPEMNTDDALNSLHGLPAYQEILQKMNLAD